MADRIKTLDKDGDEVISKRNSPAGSIHSSVVAAEVVAEADRAAKTIVPNALNDLRQLSKAKANIAKRKATN